MKKFDHRRTQGDFMAAMLEAVTPADWTEIVKFAVTAAKRGDAQARVWLGQYLVGRPEAPAPAPATVIVNQIAGHSEVAHSLAMRKTFEGNSPLEALERQLTVELEK